MRLGAWPGFHGGTRQLFRGDSKGLGLLGRGAQPELLQPESFQMLRKHGVAHAYNNWAHMPFSAEQMAMPESETADFVAARFLLKPGRSYAEAVKKFEP
jgi:hypothetical protein